MGFPPKKCRGVFLFYGLYAGGETIHPQSSKSKESQILTIPLSRRIFLTRRLYTCQNPDP